MNTRGVRYYRVFANTGQLFSLSSITITGGEVQGHPPRDPRHRVGNGSREFQYFGHMKTERKTKTGSSW